MVADEKPHTLRVLCYNIHYGQGTDGRYDLERLAAVISQAKPDLVNQLVAEALEALK